MGQVAKGARTDKRPSDWRLIDDRVDPLPEAEYNPVPWRGRAPVHRLEEPVDDLWPEQQKPH